MEVKKGDRFGRWTVIEEAPRRGKVRYFLCRCQCGTVKEVARGSLVSGQSQSCGCLPKDTQRKRCDQEAEAAVLNKKFGRLTPFEDLGGSPRRFLCKCDCGSITTARYIALIKGTCRSCGCLRAEKSRELMSQIKEKGHDTVRDGWIDGTSVYCLHSRVKKNSSTKICGVSFNKKSGKFRAYINLNRRQIHLGEFATIEEAAEARKQGERKYFEPILEKFKERSDHHHEK